MITYTSTGFESLYDVLHCAYHWLRHAGDSTIATSSSSSIVTMDLKFEARGYTAPNLELLLDLAVGPGDDNTPLDVTVTATPRRLDVGIPTYIGGFRLY